jgi:hypothetical protein
MLRLCDFRSQNSSITAMVVEYVGMQYLNVNFNLEWYDRISLRHSFYLKLYLINLTLSSAELVAGRISFTAQNAVRIFGTLFVKIHSCSIFM